MKNNRRSEFNKSYILITAFLFYINIGFAQNTEEANNFIRGNKLIFTDNFSKDAIGDFPARWSSTQGGEINNIDGFEEKFLKVPGGSIINLLLTKPLPQDFTLDYDIVLPADERTVVPTICFGAKLEKLDIIITRRNGLQFSLIRSDRKGYGNKLLYGNYSTSTTLNKIDYTPEINKKIHIGFMINGTRLRLFIDGVKMLDLPTQFLNSYRKNIYLNSPTNGWQETKTSYFYVSNFTLAETGKDARSKVVKDLFEMGRASTTAIKFKVNSDALLPESNAIINELVVAMKANASAKVKIIGHTDSDGDDAKNMALSLKRANAVKAKMMSLGIESTRLTTEGLGESKPAADNSSAEGKAKNRRVEFIKM
ncbi:OmpA family protein [Pedobacter aquatilis]|uniref:OmpA family protein n=1 Tax=Pedobacter aquatilis TaxID=351343 RepID=UPI0025B4BD45|nr:OmpA family protein [Pedobacter aquatilis]MDN3588951.1 OmpA family protein [Pedobacter aquatilis]